MKKYVVLAALAWLMSGCGDNYGNLKYVDGSYENKECRNDPAGIKAYQEQHGVDRIVVEKKNRKMHLYRGDKKIDTFDISLGKNPDGHKEKQGDFRTPIGTYKITIKKCHPKYYRMINISYPNEGDVMIARKKGHNPGNGITIHAQPFWNANGKGDKYTLSKDWTNGCIAVTNSSMQKLWASVRNGTIIEIKA